MRIFPSRRDWFRLWLLLFPAFLVFWYFPCINFSLRLLTGLTLLLVVVGALLLCWKRNKLRWCLLSVYSLIAIFLVFPSQLPEGRAELRSRYTEALKSYLGCRYVWGGEGVLGMDCSGLVRKGMEDALASQGISTFNPALIRASIFLYWHDTTAQVMGQGYGGRMIFVTLCRSLNSLDHSLLLPGDLAVTTSADHVLIYLGDKTWIAADPGARKVTSFLVPEPYNAYFLCPCASCAGRH